MAEGNGGGMRPKKPRTRKGWKKYCDNLWSYAVRLRDNFTCQKCHKKYPENSRGLHPHHLFTRSKKSTRWDMDNGLTLCFAHHLYAHSHPHDFKDWLIGKKGQEWWSNLRYMSNQIKKIDLELTAVILEAVIREMEDDRTLNRKT